MDWKEDPWFVKYHYDKLTEEFKDWWRVYYGPIDNESERHEYWARCAFALAGWKAATGTSGVTLIANGNYGLEWKHVFEKELDKILVPMGFSRTSSSVTADDGFKIHFRQFGVITEEDHA